MFLFFKCTCRHAWGNRLEMPMLVCIFLFIRLSQSLNCLVCCGIDHKEGGIVGCCHLLKDTASGSHTFRCACIKFLVCVVCKHWLLFSIHHTIHNSTLQTQHIGQWRSAHCSYCWWWLCYTQDHGTAVWEGCNHTPQPKPLRRIEKHFEHLVKDYLALADLGASLKTHFLVGRGECLLLLCAWPSVWLHVTAGVWLYSRNEEGFCAHMRRFVPHHTDECHSLCLHAPQPPKASPRLDWVENLAAVQVLTKFIKGYLADQQQYLHRFSTIQLESLNGSACKCVDKECNWSVMYGPLFDAGILECNEGMISFLLSWEMGTNSHHKIR